MLTEALVDSEERVATALRQSPKFAGLDDSAIQRLVAAMRIHHFNKGEFVFMDGDPMESYFIVLRGMVRLIKQSPRGRIFTVAVVHSVDTLSDITIFSDTPVFVSAEVMKPTTILSIARDEFLSVVARNPVLATRIMETVGERVKSITERVIWILSETAECRVWRVVLMLSSEYGNVIPFTHQDIADMAGVVRETASRAIENLQQSLGIVHSFHGSITILDMAKLKQLLRDTDTT